jgi:UDP-N-acetylglucosamine--N-acetylmuramyl-(pentapeptide) pyrophosphoryl-undecaprenol N-acetylglucosamine transferase
MGVSAGAGHDAKPIALAAGGTGGHMFPAEALAHCLLRRGRAVSLITDRRGRAFAVEGGEIDVYRIRAETVSGPNLLTRVRGLIDLGLGTIDALRLLRRLQPAAVIGFGGYASFPTMVAAVRLGIAAVLHEQNAVLGRANRFLAHGATRIATSFPDVAGLRPIDRGKTVLTGNPVRRAIAELSSQPYAPANDGAFRLLITGGSQGARIFGRVVPAALSLLPEALRRRILVNQQCRPDDVDDVRRRYDVLGLTADVQPFFADMAARLGAAHLVIARAGASTVAELTAAGRPALLVPYPHAADDHQTANAAALESAGAAWTIPEPAFSPEALAARLQPVLSLPEPLVRLAAQARRIGVVDAAERLADVVETALPANGNRRPAEPAKGRAA